MGRLVRGGGRIEDAGRPADRVRQGGLALDELGEARSPVEHLPDQDLRADRIAEVRVEPGPAVVVGHVRNATITR